MEQYFTNLGFPEIREFSISLIFHHHFGGPNGEVKCDVSIQFDQMYGIFTYVSLIFEWNI